jgi:hypothetical protein
MVFLHPAMIIKINTKDFNDDIFGQELSEILKIISFLSVTGSTKTDNSV